MVYKHKIEHWIQKDTEPKTTGKDKLSEMLDSWYREGWETVSVSAQFEKFQVRYCITLRKQTTG